jgi:hypothetical protein
MITVTDGVEEVCMVPGETGAILEAGGVGGPGPPVGGKEGQWRRVDIAKCLRTQETGLSQHQARGPK